MAYYQFSAMEIKRRDLSIFEQDISYPFRNVPLNIYTQYNLNLSEVKVL
jgi:hypothetical protein